MAKILVHNPQAPEPKARGRVTTLKSLRESRAGVLRNQKQHAGLLMSRIVDDLSQKYGVIKNAVAERPTSSRADPAVLDELVKSCDWVITGSAD